MARRLHRGSAGQRHHLDDDGGRRAGAALGRRLQPVLRGRSAAEVDVRPGGRLADRVAGARAVLRRGRAAAERQRRAEPASRGSAVRAVPAGADSAVLQPADAEDVGGAERDPVLAAADGAQPDAVRRPRQLLRLRHLRRGLSVGRALLARLHLQAADRAEEDRAARSHARAPADPRREAVDDRRRAGGAPGSARTIRSSTARRRSSSRRATAGARICCCCRRTAVPERAREQLRPRRALHERTQVHPGDGEHRRPDVPRPEHDAQPDLAAVLPLPDRQAVRPARHARLGELGRPRSAAARAGRQRCCSATS